MNKDKPGFYAILPATVRYDKRLKPIERLLYAEITALSNTQGYCNASNSYFSKVYDITPTTASRYIANLITHGYVNSQMIFAEDKKQIKERRLYPITGIDEMSKGGIDQTSKDNTTSNNNTSINKIIYNVVSYLNKETGARYGAKSKPTRDKIRARINEGYKEQDFYKVINNMVKAADNGTWGKNMHKYLRPSTLFGTKFEQYLNWVQVVEQPDNKLVSIDKGQYDTASNEW